MCAIFYHYMSVSRSVTPRPAHMFSIFFCIRMPVHVIIRHIHIHNALPPHNVCVSVFLRPYVRISCSQLCVRVSVCHIQVYYTSLSYISTTVCRSMCLCVCLFSCKYILHVQLFVRLFVTFVRHPLNTCLCVQLSIRLNFVSVCKSVYSSVLCLSHSYALCSLHTCPRFLPRDAYA